jgi:hypothetical protein
MTMTSKIEIETSCGEQFEMLPSEMTDRQLRGLLKQNPDGDPEGLAAMRAELDARADREMELRAQHDERQEDINRASLARTGVCFACGNTGYAYRCCAGVTGRTHEPTCYECGRAMGSEPKVLVRDRHVPVELTRMEAKAIDIDFEAETLRKMTERDDDNPF